jgi:hypothetical protein
MQMVSTRTAAIRMAILLCAIDVAAALLIAKPRLWCAVIPALIPIFTPAVIFSFRGSSKAGDSGATPNFER